MNPDILEPWHDIQQKKAFWSAVPFISSHPQDSTTAPPYPLLLTWARQSRTERSWVPTNLVPTTKFGTAPHPLPPPPLQNATQRLNPVWNSSELGYLFQITIREKEQRAAGEDNLPWKQSLGVKMLSITAVSHPSAAAVLQRGVQITGSVQMRTCSHTVTSRSQRTDLTS